MLSLIAVVGAIFLIGFACGYGVRELLSRRRRAIERKRYHDRHG
jgi:hypothetical protein